MVSQEVLNELKNHYDSVPDTYKNIYADVTQYIIEGGDPNKVEELFPEIAKKEFSPVKNPSPDFKVAGSKPIKKSSTKQKKRYGVLSDSDIPELVKYNRMIHPFKEENLNDYSYSLTLKDTYIEYTTIQELKNSGEYKTKAKNPHLFEETSTQDTMYPYNILHNIEYVDTRDIATQKKLKPKSASKQEGDGSGIIIIPGKTHRILLTTETITLPTGVIAEVFLSNKLKAFGLIASPSFLDDSKKELQILLDVFNSCEYPLVLHVGEVLADIKFTRPYSICREDYEKRAF